MLVSPLQGILLVYDITNRWSFDGIDRWIREIDEVGVCLWSPPSQGHVSMESLCGPHLPPPSPHTLPQICVPSNVLTAMAFDSWVQCPKGQHLWSLSPMSAF